MQLERVISISDAEAQLLIPIFRDGQGGNLEFIQELSFDGFVKRFLPVDFPFREDEYVNERRQVELGAEGIWCVRTLDGVVTLRHSEMSSVAINILSDKRYLDYPFFRVEMASFLEGDVSTSALKLAYFQLSKFTEVGANVWRDAVVLLPLAREGIDTSLRSSRKFELKEVSLHSATGQAFVSVPGKPLNIDINFDKLLEIGSALGIHSAKVIWQNNDLPSDEARNVKSTVIGFCSMTHFVLSHPPFLSVNISTHNDISYTYHQDFHGVTGLDEQAIYILRSNNGALAAAQAVSNEFLDGVSWKSAINVRPISFGESKKSTPSISDVRDSLQGFDVLWIVANHRQKRSGRYGTGLSAQNIASRTVKNLVADLMWCDGLFDNIYEHVSFKKVDRFYSGGPLVCAYGYQQHSTNSGLYNPILAALQSMVSEDMSLKGSGKVIAFAWTNRPETIFVSEYSLNVEVFPRYMKNNNFISRDNNYVSVFALDVGLVHYIDDGFSNFICDIIRGYHEVDFEILSEKVVLVYLNNISIKLLIANNVNQICYFVDNSESKDIIITGLTLTKFVKRYASDRDRNVIHYSDLHNNLFSRVY